MKVLFIGGTGNISAAVSKLAVEKGIDLYHLNRGNRAETVGVKTIAADIRNLDQTKVALAAIQWDVVVNWIAFTPDDIWRDVKIFEGKVAQYIFISSASAYQKPVVKPVITESTPLINPFWDYSRNKISCEDILMNLYQERHFPVTIVRPSHTYNTVIPVSLGGWEQYTVVDRMKKGLPVVVHGDGTSLWTETHADDFAKGFVGLLGNQRALGEAFHITSDEVLTWNQIYQEVARAAGCEAQIVHIASEAIADYADELNYPSVRGTLLGDKTHCAIFDNSKIKKFVPGYEATIPFTAGIRRTIGWFEADPSRMIVKEETNRFLDGLIKKYGR
jgi:nucleoside-diphosphate-sugar epimerase